MVQSEAVISIVDKTIAMFKAPFGNADLFHLACLQETYGRFVHADLIELRRTISTFFEAFDGAFQPLTWTNCRKDM